MQIDRSRLTRVVTALNDKGGVFKTSLVANVGGLLAASGYKTLLIDLDPQGNLAQDLGYQDRSDQGDNLFLALRRGSSTPLTPLENVRPDLDVLPGGANLDQLRLILDGDSPSTTRDPRGVLAEALMDLAPRYDFILIDTPPKVPVLQNLALGASKWVLIPTRPDAASREGLEHVTGMFVAAQDFNPDLALLGVVIAGVSAASRRIRRETWSALVDGFDGDDSFLFQTMLRTSESTAFDTRNRGLLVPELERGSKKLSQSAGGLAGDYQELTVEIVARLADAETAGEE